MEATQNLPVGRLLVAGTWSMFNKIPGCQLKHAYKILPFGYEYIRNSQHIPFLPYPYSSSQKA
jgi:hypothetical protein